MTDFLRKWRQAWNGVTAYKNLEQTMQIQTKQRPLFKQHFGSN